VTATDWRGVVRAAAAAANHLLRTIQQQRGRRQAAGGSGRADDRRQTAGQTADPQSLRPADGKADGRPSIPAACALPRLQAVDPDDKTTSAYGKRAFNALTGGINADIFDVRGD
jgi:hypothetical protein